MSKPTAAGRELTLEAIVLGLILSVVMGAANVYLGLKAGMTVSASIPAAVISMGILRGILRRGSIRESNLVQTAASAGESLAAGIIFTMPALILIGAWEDFEYWTITLVAFAGGLLGILFMIPMRRVFIVNNTELAYPEGVACAEVLRAGESGTTGVGKVFLGIAIGAVFKFFASFLGMVRSTAETAMRAGNSAVYIGADLSPALLGVGYIVGLNIAILIFMGGAIGWFVAIPIMGGLEGGAPLDHAWTLWDEKVRYLGVGTMVVGGIWTIWQVRGGLVGAVREIRSRFGGTTAGAVVDDTERDIDGRTILGLSVLCTAVIFGIYYHLTGGAGLSAVTTVIMIVMSFFFTAVASYIVGLVGNSNSPVSGMTITAVLFTGALLLLFGFEGESGMIAVLGVAGVVCCAACTSGDVCNDLKTGTLVGASPRRQQIMQVLGVAVASLIMGPVLVALHHSVEGGIGSRELSAPQASLFASLARGFFGDGELPWDMVAIGAVIGVGIIAIDEVLKAKKSSFRTHIMPVAVGIYLPFGLAIPILVGGLIQTAVRRASRSRDEGEDRVKRGVLFASGIIAGESLIGVGLAILAYAGVSGADLLPENVSQTAFGDFHFVPEAIMTFGIVAMIAIAVLFYTQSNREDDAGR
jgi:putative OPT family oligopeptide transporter